MQRRRLTAFAMLLALPLLAGGCDMKQDVVGPPAGGGDIVVNEFMASNSASNTDEFGGFDDWIELYNRGDEPVDLSGWHVTDNLTKPDKYVIPSGSSAVATIPAKGFLVIWCDSQTDQGPLHTSFNLSGGGEEIGIYDAQGDAIVEMSFGPQSTDISYGRTTDGGDTWAFFSPATPGASNVGGSTNTSPVLSGATRDPAVPTVDASVTVGVTITDDGTVVAATLQYAVDGGAFTEVAMTAAGDVWSGVIPGQEAGAAVTYYFRAVDDDDNVSTLPASAPTATLGYVVSSGMVPDLYINEFVASNDAGVTDDFGDYEDWIEIYNPGAEPVDLGGMYITDDLAAPTKWQIPATDPAATTVPAGGYLVLWADSEPSEGVRHVNIKLSASGEAIGLYTTAGEVIDEVTFGVQTLNVSAARVPDGSANWVFLTTPTPGATNGSSPSRWQ
jgi:hypothetical protein